MSPAPRILLFADAGAAVGGGHVMRCLTLADALERRGAVCAFAATPAATGVLDVFAGESIERLALPDEPPTRLAPLLGDLARRWSPQGLVVDHYGFGPMEEATVRGGVHRLMALDDLKRAHLCDLVLDSNLDRHAQDYPGVDSLIGPDFALVRPAFGALREKALARRTAAAPVRRVLVALGLTDFGAITGRVIEAILPVLTEAEVDIVLGQGAASLPGLVSLASRERRLNLHINTREMAALTAGADLAIGAGGSSVWERCVLGLPSLTVVLADNQRDAARSLTSQGAALALEASDPDFAGKLAASLKGLAADPVARAKMSAAASAVCDGQGADRVAERLIGML